MWIDDCQTPSTVDKLTFKNCLNKDSASTLAPSVSGQPLAMREMEAQIKDLRNDLAQLGAEVKDKWLGDSFVMARMREEADSVRKKKNQDRIIVLGAVSLRPRPKVEEGKEANVKWLRETAGKALNKIVPDSAKEIIFVSTVRPIGPGPPMLDIQMTSTSVAIGIRMAKEEQQGWRSW